MVQLVRAELTRLRWRKAVVGLMAAAIVLPTLILGGLLWETRPVTQADLDNARAEMEASAAMSIADCQEYPRHYGIRPKELTEEQVTQLCERRAGDVGDPEDWIYRAELTVRETREGGAGLAVAAILVLLAALIGTTFAGHDWATGSMGNQLLFEPRRWRVWAAKLGAVLVGTTLMAAAALGLFWGGVWVATEVRDLTIGDHQWWWTFTSALRSVVLVAGAGGAAYALTMLLRTTVGALGVVVGATVGSSIFFAGVLGEHGMRWMLTNNAAAFVLGEYEYWVENEECWRTNDCTELLTGPQAGVYLGGIVLVVAVVSLLSFRRRDVP